MDTNLDDNLEPAMKIQQKPKRPKAVTVAAILLIVLTVFVAGLGIATQYGLLGQGFGNRQFTPGQFRNGNFPPGGFPGNGNGPNGFQGANPGTNGLPNDQNGQGITRTFPGNRAGVAGFARIFRILRPVTLALDIIVLVLSVIAVVGLFMNKRWGSILAIVISAVVILLTLPSMIRIFSPLILVENLVRILMAVAVIVLLLLPSTRKSYTAASSSDEVEVERVVR